MKFSKKIIGMKNELRKIKDAAANLITGARIILSLVLPLTIFFIEIKYSAMVVCLLATSAAVQEGHLIKKSGGESHHK